jgi:sulfatase modifying factor 1
MKWIVLLLFTVIPLANFGQTAEQNVPVNYRIHYYYRVTDSVPITSSIIPNKKLVKLLQRENCIFIDSITFSQEGQNGYDSIWNTNKKFSVAPFFVRSTETTNAEYKAFLLQAPAVSNYPDTSVWRDPQIADHPYIHYYFQHHAYAQYPVVGISHQQAVNFCKWKEKQLQQVLESKGIKEYRIEVSLPTEQEWQAVYGSLFPKWLLRQKDQKSNQYMLPNATAYVLGAAGYRANFGDIGSARLQSLKLPFTYYSSSGGILTHAQSYPSVFGVYNLLGNVAEWTSTAAELHLFNTTEYLYTVTDKIIPLQTRIDSVALRKKLHQPAVMAQHYAIKGGSWNEEFFYLQPAAVQFRDQRYRAKNLGFRYVIRVFPSGKK